MRRRLQRLLGLAMALNLDDRTWNWNVDGTLQQPLRSLGPQKLPRWLLLRIHTSRTKPLALLWCQPALRSARTLSNRDTFGEVLRLSLLVFCSAQRFQGYSPETTHTRFSTTYDLHESQLRLQSPLDFLQLTHAPPIDGAVQQGQALESLWLREVLVLAFSVLSVP